MDPSLLRVEDLDLGSGTKSTLIANGYPTAAEILAVPAARLTRLRGIGRGVLLRLQRELAAGGHDWDVPEVLIDTPDWGPGGSQGAGDTTPIGVFNLSVRTVNSLYRGGYPTAGEVRAASDADLMGIRNFGTGQLIEVRREIGHGAASPSAPVADDNDYVGFDPDPDEPTGIDDAVPLHSVVMDEERVEVLIAAGIETSADLRVFAPGEIAAMHGIGTLFVHRLVIALSRLGQPWTPSDDVPLTVMPPKQNAKDNHKTALADLGLSPNTLDELERLKVITARHLTVWNRGVFTSLVSHATFLEADDLMYHYGWWWRDSVAEDSFQTGLRTLWRYVLEHERHPIGRDVTHHGYRLGQWVMWVRQQHQSGTLDPYRAYTMEQIDGWVWAPKAAGVAQSRIAEGIDAAERFAATHGHVLPDRDESVDGVILHGLLMAVREHPEALMAVHRARLEALPGWTWNQQDVDDALTAREMERRENFVSEEWLGNFDALRTLALAKGGIANVKSTDLAPDGRPIGHWATAQRSRRATLRPRQVALLESIPDWSWDGMAVRDARNWQAAYDRLLAYVTAHGTSAVPYKYVDPDGYALGAWVSRQRHSKATLSEEQKARFEALPGWTWRKGERLGSRARPETKALRDQEWEAMRQRVENFYAAHRRMPFMKEKDAEGKSIGGWVVAQRQKYRMGTIDADRAVRLDETPGWVWEGQRGAAARTTSLKDVFDAGLVTAGDTLVALSPKWAHGSGRITAEGRIDMAGKICTTPTEAESVVTGLSASRGWSFWGIERDGQVTPLVEIRDRFEREQPAASDGQAEQT